MFGIQKVSEMTGISSITLRAWERRYGIIQPKRADGGHRLYSAEDIDDIIWVKKQKEEKGISLGQTMELLKKRRGMESQNQQKIPPQIGGGSFEDFSTELFDALINYEMKLADKLINISLAMYDFEEVCHYIFIPILHRIGNEWADGRLSVAQEHLISSFLERRIQSFLIEVPEQPLAVRAIALCPELEQHKIGLLLFSLFLNKRGVQVYFLGQNTPVDYLEKMIAVNQIRLVCISMTIKQNSESIQEMITKLSRSFNDITFVIGGEGTNFLPADLTFYQINGGLEEWKNWFIEFKRK